MHLSLGPPKTPIAVAVAPTMWLPLNGIKVFLKSYVYFCGIIHPKIESLEIILTIVPALIVNLNLS